jgi:hypothetical protein
LEYADSGMSSGAQNLPLVPMYMYSTLLHHGHTAHEMVWGNARFDVQLFLDKCESHVRKPSRTCYRLNTNLSNFELQRATNKTNMDAYTIVCVCLFVLYTFPQHCPYFVQTSYDGKDFPGEVSDTRNTAHKILETPKKGVFCLRLDNCSS